jgi:glycerol uptake facilitator protein
MKSTSKEFISEFCGTFIMILFGTAVVAMVVLFQGSKGGYENITWAWGFAVMFGIYVGAYSGAHLNPAVTFALAITNRFQWSKVPHFILAQILGAFFASLIVYLNYYSLIHQLDPGLSSTAGIFTTFPEVKTNLLVGLGDQILGTFILLYLILASIDNLKKSKAEFLIPIVIGILVVTIGMCFGGLHGYAINPARDFGPRAMITMMGFENNGLTQGSLIFLVPIVGPLIGGALGAIAYDKTLGAIHRENEANVISNTSVESSS